MKYYAPKCSRIKSYGFTRVEIETPCPGYWWKYTNNTSSNGVWEKIDPTNIPYGISSRSCSVKSLRAFRRRLKQWSKQLPKGTKLCLLSKWINHDVIGIIK